MKKYKSIGKLLAVSFFTAVIASACTEDAICLLYTSDAADE